MKMTKKEIGKHLGRSHTGIQDRAQRLGYSKYPRWSDNEINLLIVERGKGTSVTEISKMVGRKQSATYSKMRSLGLDPVFKKWTDDEVTIVTEEYNKGTPTVRIASIIERSRFAISYKARALGLKHPYFNGSCKYGSSGKTLIHRLQNGKSGCARCGITKFLSVSHKYGNGARLRRKYGNSSEEYKYWLKRPIKECRETLEVLCMNCNKIEYYNRKGISKDSLQKQVLKRIAEAYKRPVECFECRYSEDIRVLEVDHKIKDGYEADSLYRRILNMPLGEIKRRYQILCTNHNLWKNE